MLEKNLGKAKVCFVNFEERKFYEQVWIEAKQTVNYSLILLFSINHMPLLQVIHDVLKAFFFPP